MTEKSVPRICFSGPEPRFLFFLFLLILQRHHKCRNQLFLSRHNTLQLAADLVDRKIFKSFFNDFLCPASAPNIAGLLCAAIISDTLMFRSPTCTMLDKAAAEALADIAEISIPEFASEMFRAGSNLKDKSPEEIFYQDFKKFIMGDVTFGVGQITSLDAGELESIKEQLLPQMESECGKHGIEMVFFMLTNIIEEHSYFFPFLFFTLL